jgi:molybdate transport repressor ModE-like protein
MVMSPRARAPELASLRLLVAVDRHGSLGQAARHEGISQPAASKRIAHLEQSFGIPLVRRTPRGSRLTAQGQVVADWSRRVIDNVDHLLGAVSSLRVNDQSDLRVAASMTIAEHLVPSWLHQLRTQHPKLHVGLHVANSDQVQREVLSGEADLGFVETPTIDPSLASKTIGHDRLVIVVAPTHALATGRTLALRELARTPLVVREPGSGTRATLDRVLAERERASPLLELGSNAAVKGAVLAGAGPAALSRLAVATELDTGQLVEVRTTRIDLARRLRAIWRRPHPMTGSSSALLQIATRTFHDRA